MIRRLAPVTILVALIWIRPGSAADESPQPLPVTAGVSSPVVTPPDVLVRARLLGRYVEDLRWLHGVPATKRLTLRVRKAQPREVFFQARALHEKVAQLNERFTNTPVRPAPGPVQAIPQPADVKALLDDAIRQTLEIRASFGFQELYEPGKPSAQSSPTDVYHEVLLTSRQVSALLQHAGEAGTLVPLVAEMRQLVLAIIQKSGATAGAVAEHPLEYGVTPADLFQHLVLCLRLMHDTFLQLEEPMLAPLTEAAVQVSYVDVTDLSNLLISELTYLATRAGAATDTLPLKPEQRVRITPTDILRELRYVERQLVVLYEIAGRPGSPLRQATP